MQAINSTTAPAKVKALPQMPSKKSTPEIQYGTEYHFHIAAFSWLYAGMSETRFGSIVDPAQKCAGF